MAGKLLSRFADHEFRIKVFKQSLVWFSNLMLGHVMIICGPTLLDLQAQTGTSVQEINVIFSISAAGYVIGAFCTGLLLGYNLNIQVYIGTAALIMGVTCASIPWFSTLLPMLIMAFLMNLAGGGIESACNFWTLKIWGSESMVSFQLNSLFFGAGSLLAPSFAAPFLSSGDTAMGGFENHLEELEANGTLAIGDEYLVVYDNHHLNMTTFQNSSMADLADEMSGISGIRVPYMIIGILCAILTGLFGFSFWNWPTEKEAECASEADGLISYPTQKFIVVFFMSCFSLGFAGICIIFPRYLTTFAVRGLQASKATGAYMTSVYWAGYTFSRIGTLPLALFLSNKQMLTFDCTVMLIGSVMLIIFGTPVPAIHGPVSRFFGLEPVLGPDNPLLYGFWAGIATLSVGASSVFVLLFTFMEENMEVKSWMPSIMSVVYGGGEFVYPILLGHFIEDIPEMLLYTMLINSSICIVFLAAFTFAARRRGRDVKVQQELKRQMSIAEENPEYQTTITRRGSIWNHRCSIASKF